jgi:TRAP-type C4-dicarboxylate transport system permease small subunit
VANLLLKPLRALLGVALMASVLLICANAFGRYVLHKPIIWAEEVLGYALVWMVYLGSILVTLDRQHLRMDLLSQMLGTRARRVLDLFGALVFAAVGGLIVYQSFESIRTLAHRSQVADLPMNIVHLVVPVSFAIMVVLMLVLAVQDFRGGIRETGTTSDKGEGRPS